jgi:hypothetical protein
MSRFSETERDLLAFSLICWLDPIFLVDTTYQACPVCKEMNHETTMVWQEGEKRFVCEDCYRS